MIGDLAAGLAMIGRGQARVMGRPRLFGLGLLPPLVSSAILAALFVTLLFQLDTITAVLTGWADGPIGDALQIVLGVLIIILALVIMAILYSSITLALGAPVYDQISELVEQGAGGVTHRHDEPLRVAVSRSLRQTVRLLVVSVAMALPLFLLGLIPVVGQVFGAVAGAVFGGWMICVEMISATCDRRGRVSLRDKFAAMRSAPWLSLGFGIPAFLLVSLPVVAVIVFPAVTAGGTLLARRLLGEPTAPVRDRAG